MKRKDKNQKEGKNPFDMLILPALVISAILYALQLWQVIDIPSWGILAPILIVSCVIGVFMLFCIIVAWIALRKK